MRRMSAFSQACSATNARARLSVSTHNTLSFACRIFLGKAEVVTGDIEASNGFLHTLTGNV